MTMSNSTESASRIPVTLRRSASLRQKGERCCHGRSPHQHQHDKQRQQEEELFPAITESNTDAAQRIVLMKDRQQQQTPLRRSSSAVSLTPPLRHARSRPATAAPGRRDDWESDSVRSFGASSNCSQYSLASTSASRASCEHAHFGLNGTTWSARTRRYVVHRSPQARAAGGGDDEAEQYLTPTQRAARQLRKLESLLRETRQELEERDHEIARLTKELVELRLLKASPPSTPDKKPAQSSLQLLSSPSPLVDSGHFEEQKESASQQQTDSGKIEEMQRRHLDEIQLLKQAHHDKLESLLNRLADMSTRYCEARPALEQAQARGRQLEAELDELRQQLQHSEALLLDQEERNKRAYLDVYAKGQQAARIEQQHPQTDLQPPDVAAAKVSVAELLQQLAVTQAELDNVKPFQDSCYTPEHLTLACRSQHLLSLQEAVSLWVLGTRKAMYRRILESRSNKNALDPEITLQFLKSAIYYFLTDKDNLHGHLNAIESILGFTDSEKLNIDRIYRSAKK